MFKPNTFLTIIALTASLACNSAFAAIQTGSTAPDFTVKTADGNEVSLSDFKGKTVVLEWLNYECPFSKMHYSGNNFPKLQSTYTSKDVIWLSVASSAEGKQGYFTAKEYAEQNKKYNSSASHILLDYDGKIATSYEAKTTPHMFVIDGKGIVQYNGAIDSIPSADTKTLADAVPYTANAIDAILENKIPSPAATQPYGCGIKFKSIKGYDK